MFPQDWGLGGRSRSSTLPARILSVFVDIHNHILPGIDDGSPTMDFALEMARLAVADGTDIMVATPHRTWTTRLDAPADWVREQVALLAEQLTIANIPLTVLPGVEIPIGPRVAIDLVDRRLSTLGDAGASALIELPFDYIPADSLANLELIVNAGITVVLAHPERYAVLQKDLTFAEACADLGIIFQLTTGSILGRFGPKAQASAEAFLKRYEKFEIVISSDTHDLKNRPPNLMSNARKAAAKIVGKERADNMVNARPRALITRQA